MLLLLVILVKFVKTTCMRRHWFIYLLKKAVCESATLIKRCVCMHVFSFFLPVWLKDRWLYRIVVDTFTYT